MSRPRGPRQRGAPAPPPPLLRAAGGCSARLQLYSQAGTARAAGGGGPRGAGAGGGARRRGEGARTPAPAARAPCGGRGPGKGARWGRGRAAAASASCAPGGSRCTSRPPLPPGPGPRVGGRGGGERNRLRRSGRVGSRPAPAAWGSSRSEGDGQESRNPVLLPRGLYLAPLLANEAGSRAWAWCFTPTPPLARPARLFSPRGRACPPPPQTGFSALLGSVGTSPCDSPLPFIFPGLYFAGRAQRRVAFFLYPAPARARFLPQGGLGCPLWQEVGPGAPAWRCMRSGCTGFPRLLERPSPRAFWPLVPPVDLQRPSADTCSHPGTECGAGGHGDFTKPPRRVRKVAGSAVAGNLLHPVRQLAV